MACCTMQKFCLGLLGKPINSMKAKKEKKKIFFNAVHTNSSTVCRKGTEIIQKKKKKNSPFEGVYRVSTLSALRGLLPQHFCKLWYVGPFMSQDQ